MAPSCCADRWNRVFEGIEVAMITGELAKVQFMTAHGAQRLASAELAGTELSRAGMMVFATPDSGRAIRKIGA